MKFVTWLKKFESEESAIGDLARDVKADIDTNFSEFPIGENDHDAIRDHLYDAGASDAALETFEKAWARYKSDN